MTEGAPVRSVVVARDLPALAELAVTRLLDRIAGVEGEVAVCLTGGTTPHHMYELLAHSPWRARVPWDRVHWFMSDERFVAHASPLSNSGTVKRLFLDACAPPDHVHMIETDKGSLDQAVRDYEKVLLAHRQRRARAALFDVVLMGVGPDGHTASLFPDAETLAEDTRWVVGVPNSPIAPFVPRVSLTLPVLAKTYEMIFLCSGAEKREILRRIFTGEDLPAAHAQAAFGETVWLLDAAAAPADVTNDARTSSD